MPEIYYQDEYTSIVRGECLEAMSMLPANAVDVTLTDPPYNADFDYGDYTDDTRPWSEYLPWLQERIVEMERVTSGPVIVFVSITGMMGLTRWRRPHWVGGWFRPGSGHPTGDTRVGMGFQSNWEPFVVYGNLKAVRVTLPDAVVTQTLAERNGHPCPKSQALFRRLLERFPARTRVLDPFLGSGTTLRVAKDLAFKGVGIEINPDFCRIARARISQESLFHDMEVVSDGSS